MKHWLCCAFIVSMLFTASLPGFSDDGKGLLLVINRGSGKFLELDYGVSRVRALWSLERLDTIVEKNPECLTIRRVPSYCQFELASLQYSAKTQVLYAVMTSNPEAPAERAEKALPQYQLVALELPMLRVLHLIPLVTTDWGPPKVLISSDGTRLAVANKERASSKGVVSLYKATDLSRPTEVFHADDVADIAFSDAAHLDNSGTQIFDGASVVTLKNGRVERKNFDIRAKFTSEELEVLKPFMTKGAGTGPANEVPRLRFVAIDSYDSTSLYRVIDQDREKMALWTVDLATGNKSALSISGIGTAKLLPNRLGVVIVLAKLGSTRHLAATGVITVVDLANGQTKAEIQVPQIKDVDSERIMSCAPTSDLVLLGAERLFGVTLNGGHLETAPNVEFPFDEAAQCFATHE